MAEQDESQYYTFSTLAGLAIERNVKLDAIEDAVGGGGHPGDGSASSANQALQLAQETTTASNTTSINTKMSKGSDATLTEAQQVGSYVVNESTGLFQPLSAHHSNKSLKTTDANITKGEDIITGGAGGLQQVLMYGKTASGGNNLQPVELTGDRLIVDVQELNVGFTQNSGGSMTQSGAVQIYGGYDDGLGGVRKMRTLKCDDNGVLETSGGGGGGGSTQYDSASTLPTPTVGTAVLGVDSGGLANVISTDDTGKVGSVIHGTVTSGVAYPVAINQFSRALTVDDAVNKTSYLTTQTATIPASTSNYFYPTVTSLGSARSFTIFGNTTNWSDSIYLYAAKNGYSGIKYKMWENPIQPDPSSGDFYINLPLTATPYLYWGKDNTTLVSETITVEIIYMD